MQKWSLGDVVVVCIVFGDIDVEDIMLGLRDYNVRMHKVRASGQTQVHVCGL